MTGILDRILLLLGCEHPRLEPVNVEKLLDDGAAAYTAGSGQRLDWRHSVVDLMKALDLDPRAANREALAMELHYPGELGSPGMNEWLRKEIMKRVAENGGKVPVELL